MREFRTSGSVGAAGERSPVATRRNDSEPSGGGRLHSDHPRPAFRWMDARLALFERQLSGFIMDARILDASDPTWPI